MVGGTTSPWSIDGVAQTATLYLDGQLVGSASGSCSVTRPQHLSTRSGPDSQTFAGRRHPEGWYGFVGRIEDVRVWSQTRTAAAISHDMTTAPTGTEPGLKAYYPLDDGTGPTAHDITPNHNDGTLAGSNGDLPTWVTSGAAIDLGGDGITRNSISPRQGPNNLQNSPIIVTTAAGRIEGWLGGSTPDTTYRIDVFAAAGFAVSGAGQAEAYLGSLEVTTDASGQAFFDVPFTPPAGKPVVTATATDPQGDTSEISTLRRAALQSPAQNVRLVPGQPVIFSAAAGDAITLQDPDAGPLAPAWDSDAVDHDRDAPAVGDRGLDRLRRWHGIVDLQGPLSALNAALDGLTFTAAAGAPASNTLTVTAASEGASAVQSHVVVREGIFSVTSTADTGPGSLRQAILDSNLTPGGRNVIAFAIPGAGVQTIAPLSALPAITAVGADRRLLPAGLRRHAADRAQRQTGRQRRRADDHRLERHRPRPGHQRLLAGRRHPHHGSRRDRQRDRSQRHRHRPDRDARPAQCLWHSDPCRRQRQRGGRDGRRGQPDRLQYRARRRRRGGQLPRQPGHRQPHLRQRQAPDPIPRGGDPVRRHELRQPAPGSDQRP